MPERIFMRGNRFKMKCILIIIGLLTTMQGTAQPRKTRNLIVVTTDGYRWKELFRGADSAKMFSKRPFGMDSTEKIQMYWGKDRQERREKLMPFFWNYIAKHGQIYGNRDLGNKVDVTNPYKTSYPGYNEIFTGFPDPGVTNGTGPNPNKTLLEFLNNQPAYKGKVAVYASWDEYYNIFNVGRSRLPVNAGWTPVENKKPDDFLEALNLQHKTFYRPFGNTERLDALTYPLARDYLKSNHPRVFYLAFIDTDAWAHRWMYDNYLTAAHHFDLMVADLWDYIQSDPFYKGQTTLFITTDHGRGTGTKWSDHFFKVPESDEIWFAVMGPDTPPLGEVKTEGQFYQKQFAKTLASFLGENFESENEIGEAIPEVLKKN